MGESSSRRFITVPEAAEYLGISKSSAWNRVYDGAIPTVKWGRLVRVDLVALEERLRERPSAAKT